MAKPRFSKFLSTVGLVWLLGIVLASIPVFANAPKNSHDVVFCPLQNQWVKRNADVPAKPRTSFTDLCASSNDKAAFVNRLVLKVVPKVSFGDLERAEAVFFEYIATGDVSFAELPSEPDLPRSPQASMGKLINAVNGLRFDPAMANTGLIWQGQLSRPPTYANAVNSSRDPLCNLKPITIAIKPRGPPVS